MGHSPKRVLVWGPRRDARPAGERRSGGALEGYPKRKRGDPTWSAARDDAYAQKERPGGEPYRPSPFGDFVTPLGDYNLSPPGRRTGLAPCKINAPPPGALKPSPRGSGANYAFAKSSPRRRRDETLA